MPCTRLTTIAVTLTAMSMAGPAFAQTPAPAQPAPASPPAAAPSPAPAAPLFATTKVEGTDNVYVFRYQNHQSMFVVTPAGVIATDPISYGRPQAAQAYLDEIRKITKAPIKYLIYSHHHYDHIAGGKPFKEAGAKIVAHRRAKERLAALKAPRRASCRTRSSTRSARSSSAARRSSSSTPGATTPTRRW